MLSPLSFAWAQPVNNLGTQVWETRGLLSPASVQTLTFNELGVNKYFISPVSYTVFLTHLHTAILRFFNLLTADLYTVSTVPTIKKMKEKRKELI